MQTEHPGRIALQSDIAEELHMEGDAARIHQLVSLLVDNAVKYTPEGGKIHIFWRKNGKKAEFSVQNTCDTLPEGDLNRLFDRFYRADASRARESGGYGIGLSVAAAIVKAHKGKSPQSGHEMASVLKQSFRQRMKETQFRKNGKNDSRAGEEDTQKSRNRSFQERKTNKENKENKGGIYDV